MNPTLPFFLEVLLGGLLTGVMYALVALGFVLIYKASGIFNFAQGAMVLFAALTFVGLIEKGLAPVLAFVATLVVMVLLAIAVERAVLRPLVNQPAISLFMATIGVYYVLDGLGQMVWGSEVRALDLGIPQHPLTLFARPGAPDSDPWKYGILVNRFDLFAALVAAVLVTALAVFFQKTRIGRALRAVADDHQAAQSVGISLPAIWVIVWSAAGAVALVAGIAWGSKLGVQSSLALVTLKALPVLILGGFTSVPGAIVGGLVIGAGENLAEVLLGPHVGGAIETWFAYILAMVVLLARPQGLFGEKIIERV
jgi:branched-chain amino acid transport system permease protein